MNSFLITVMYDDVGPTPCESERSATSQAGNVFVPSCDARGNYLPTQCQAGGQCWCVDSDGKETFGTRQHGVPNCGEFKIINSQL